MSSAVSRAPPQDSPKPPRLPGRLRLHPSATAHNVIQSRRNFASSYSNTPCAEDRQDLDTRHETAFCQTRRVPSKPPVATKYVMAGNHSDEAPVSPPHAGTSPKENRAQQR